MNFEELFLMSRIKSETAMLGFKPMKQCTWSETSFTMMDFCCLPVMMPEMYLCNSSRQFLPIRFSLPLTANTACMYICEWVPDMMFYASPPGFYWPDFLDSEETMFLAWACGKFSGLSFARSS